MVGSLDSCMLKKWHTMNHRIIGSRLLPTTHVGKKRETEKENTKKLDWNYSCLLHPQDTVFYTLEFNWEKMKMTSFGHLEFSNS